MKNIDQRPKKDKKYNVFHSTIFRIIFIVIIAVLPINLMTIAFSTMIVRNSQEQLDKEIQNSLDLSMGNLESALKRAMRQMTYLTFGDSDFIVMANTGENSSKFSTSYRSVSDKLEDVKQNYDLVDVCYFYFPTSEYMLTEGYPGIRRPKYTDTIKSMMTDSDFTGTWKVCDIDGFTVLISYDSWNKSDFGVLLNLERTLNKLNLIQNDGKVLFFMNKSETIYTLAGRQYFEEEQKTFAQIQNSDDYYVFRSELDQYDLVLVEVVEKSMKTSEMPVFLKVMQILSIVLAIVVIPLLLYFFSRQVNRPLRRLTQAIDRIEQGDLEHRIEEGRQSNEFDQINHSFNHMMDQVKELKIDVYEKELEKKDIKMQYLSQQIQPHFILNALNLLYSYEPEEYPMIQKMILCISKYFRYVVKMNAEFVELNQEMNHIKNYFEIQKARFPGLFYSIVEWNEDLSKALIPPLIVQNFAENAIKHSLKIGNRITIFVIADYFREEGQPDKMRIRLADTGEGISDELIEKIELFKKTGEHQEGLGVGIQNTIERLKYLYADKSIVRIWRDEFYGGTNVDIILPIYFEGDSF